ncbi:hypothetical protein KP509_35G005100 [Ceratopteris richardii]|uniref:Translocon-associated protein subunit alpha n=1 Tax=Ceratopteris richardii TaxID=49495 RepID=A0A8T2QCU7_CERRI|nr:hypothetical protein KP509_35G005100 [Ceratopteris richardii]
MRALLLLLLLCICLLLTPTSYAFITKVRAESGESDGEEVDDDVVKDVISDALVADSSEDFFDLEILSAPGVHTVFLFPKDAEKVMSLLDAGTPAGELAEVIVGISNQGDLPLKVHSIWASLHVSYDHRYQIQNFSAVGFGGSVVPPAIQASFPYTFTVSKFLQPGSFDLVARILYEVDGKPYQSIFYNGTIEVTEASGFLSGETLFLVTLSIGMLGVLGMWLYGQFQKLSKKSRRTKTVETGTRSVDAVNNEWLQGTAFTQKVSRSISQSKSKKKK